MSRALRRRKEKARGKRPFLFFRGAAWQRRPF